MLMPGRTARHRMVAHCPVPFARARSLAVLVVVLGHAHDAAAHGGQYRGPAPVPLSPGSAGPLTPGPGSGGPRTGGGTAPSTGWQLWWEFHKDPFLDLKRALDAVGTITGSDEFFMGASRRTQTVALAPSAADVVDGILPALKRALDRSDQRDIVSACLVAMAKIGRDHPQFAILDAMRPHLRSGDQEVRETAALAMGIAALPAALPDLAALASDSSAGRELVGRGEVDARTRAFACYGLGLLAHASDKLYTKLRCAQVLEEVLRATTATLSDRNVPVGAIQGLRLLHPGDDEQGRKLRDETVASLFAYFRKKAGPGEQEVQAHVPPAIARLLGRGGDAEGKYKEAFAAELTGASGRHSNSLVQSAAIALGVLCEPVAADQKYVDALLACAQSGKDEQARYFATMALAEIGGAATRNALLKMYQLSGKSMRRPWAALALGVLAFRAQEADDGAEPDAVIGEALRAQLEEQSNDEYRAAIAVALGLCKHAPAADDLLAMLAEYRKRDELAGYLCIGLALLGEQRAVEAIRDIVTTSGHRPELLRQAAVALGRLGDKAAADQLLTVLADPDGNLTRMSAIAGSLGFIGDRRTIAPLITILEDATVSPLSRAFAAVALGGIGEKERFRWNSKIAVDVNYRAAVETLTNGSTGILDLL